MGHRNRVAAGVVAVAFALVAGPAAAKSVNEHKPVEFIYPITLEAQLGHNPGSPYSVRSFFDISPLMSTNYNASLPNAITNQTNRDAARQAFQGFVSAANNAGVGVMLDAPFNHSAPDCEISAQGTSLFGNNPNASALFRSRAGPMNVFSRGSDELSQPPVDFVMPCTRK